MSLRVGVGITSSLSIALVLAACGGGTLYSTGAATSNLTRDDAYNCAQKQLGVMGYRTNVKDDDTRRYVAQKNDSTYKESNVKFRRRYSAIELQAQTSATGGSDLAVRASTFDEYSTERGITTVETTASSAVKTDAAALLDRCKEPTAGM
jgi:hypothetical protein